MSGQLQIRAADRGPLDMMVRGLGWFSLALGAMEIVAPRAITRALGLRGREGLVRGYGMREIAAGIGILASRDATPWMWGRVGGDALDMATVATGLAGRRKGNVVLALGMLAGVTAVDMVCAELLSRR